jgi:hypothetical protein
MWEADWPCSQLMYFCNNCDEQQAEQGRHYEGVQIWWLLCAYITSCLGLSKFYAHYTRWKDCTEVYVFRRISEGLESSLPNLETLVLTGNLIQELADLDPLASIKSLRTLSLLHNPVTTRQHYRLYVAFKLPQLRLLDFRKIKVKVSGLYLWEQMCDEELFC